MNWWVLEMCQALLDEGRLSQRHVYLQGLEAFVGTCGGVWHPDHIPWTDTASNWTFCGPPLSAYASFVSSLHYHGNGKTDTLFRGDSFTQAKGNPALVNAIAPSIKKLEEDALAPHYDAGPRNELIQGINKINLGLPETPGSIIFKGTSSTVRAVVLMCDGFLINQEAFVAKNSQGENELHGFAHGPISSTECSELLADPLKRDSNIKDLANDLADAMDICGGWVR